MIAGEDAQRFEQFVGIIPGIARQVHLRCPASVELEDLVQIGRIALWQAIHRYDPDRSATFALYARTRIRGAMLDSIRFRAYHEARIETTAIRIDADQARDLESHASAATPEPALAKLRASLPPRQAKVIELRFSHDLSRAETAAQLGISKSSVVRDEQAALASMRAAIGDPVQTPQTQTTLTAVPQPAANWRIHLQSPALMYTVRGKIVDHGKPVAIYREFLDPMRAQKELDSLSSRFGQLEPLRILSEQMKTAKGVLLWNYTRVDQIAGTLDQSIAAARARKITMSEEGKDAEYCVESTRNTKIEYSTFGDQALTDLIRDIRSLNEKIAIQQAQENAGLDKAA